MDDHLRLLALADVVDAQTLATFAAQSLGSRAHRQDVALLTKLAREFLAEHPHVGWQTLARTVQWAKAHKRHPSKVFLIVALVPHAYEDGALPELDKTWVNHALEEGIAEALRFERDDSWRVALQLTQGKVREGIYQDWVLERGASHGITGPRDGGLVPRRSAVRGSRSTGGAVPVQSALDVVG